MKVAVDAMGGDYAPHEIIKGAVEAARMLGVTIVLVGDETAINLELSQYRQGQPFLYELVPTTQVITFHDHPSEVLRTRKDSSLYRAIQLVAEDKCQAIVSAGSTGAQMAISLFVLGRIRGVLRPGLATAVPSVTGEPFYFIDVGAVADCVPENILQFARMGQVYCSLVTGKETPTVGLLNIGEEAEKGSRQLIEAHKLLAAKAAGFIGNVEPKDAFGHAADVVVSDGFTGNIFIKTMESTAETLFGMMKTALGSSIKGKLGGALAHGNLRLVKEKLDYSQYGGVPLLGVKGISIVCHGRSNATAIYHAIRVARNVSDEGLVTKLEALWK
ncbi:MAG: phosphate acyltransferase PlsX [Caldiserica bacterium]|nr:phosphate acyltransferase PlsX [Caldisericota bacterium]